jgi:RNA polymerase sigma factor (sigma-70 family)
MAALERKPSLPDSSELDRGGRRTEVMVPATRSELLVENPRATGARGDTRLLSDAAVIERSWQKSEIFAVLFDRYADDVHRYAARRLGSPLADDVLAETFAAAFQYRRRYDLSRAQARPWLYGIATNVVRRHRRAEARRLRAVSRAPLAAGVEPIAELVAGRVSAGAARQVLAGALARLPASQRDVLLLHAWAELDYGQIADALGIPLGTVRSRLHRARAQLRKALAAYVTFDSEG